MEDRSAKCVFLLFLRSGQLPGKSQLGSAHFSRAASNGTRQLELWDRDQAANGFELWWLPSISSTIALSPHKPQASKETDRGEGINPCVPTTASHHHPAQENGDSFNFESEKWSTVSDTWRFLGKHLLKKSNSSYLRETLQPLAQQVLGWEDRLRARARHLCSKRTLV